MGTFTTRLVALERSGNEKDRSARAVKLAVELREALVLLGPSFVKLAQSASTRKDIIRSEIVDVLAGAHRLIDYSLSSQTTLHLSHLQDNVPPFPSEEAYAIIKQELKQEPHELFAEFSESPIASASFGQCVFVEPNEPDT
eukprot:7760474-Pyramimonas_sp.AAC.1